MIVENCKSLHRTQQWPKNGIVHLGLGAFFGRMLRSTLKEAMSLSLGDWGVVGVSLQSMGMGDKLA